MADSPDNEAPLAMGAATSVRAHQGIESTMGRASRSL